MIDLHSHLLPGVDDGSRSVEQSVEVLRAFEAAGITDVALTPHFTASHLSEGVPASHDSAFRALVRAAPKLPRLHRGAEVMLDRPLPALTDPYRFTLGGGRWILVEFPRLVTGDAATNALRSVVDGGLLPLLAHPERYAPCTPALAERWVNVGAALQVDATTALAPTRRGERARQLLQYGLATVVAADNHGDERSVATFRNALDEQGEGAAAELLTVINPGALLSNRSPEQVPPLMLKLSLKDRFRRLWAGSE